MSLAPLWDVLTWRDAIDLLAVSFLVYNLLLFIRGTRAVQVLLGILVLGGVAYLARFLELRTLEQLMTGFFLVVLPVAIIVLFQNQIRRALVNFGRNPLIGFTTQGHSEEIFTELVNAATTMSKRRIGGLVVIERVDGLRDYVENGIVLDAKISFDLLITIFNPSTPLHDGAVIVEQGRIAAAACFMPLSSNPELSTRLGTRHRAALGISEETDAMAIVISEETGAISVAVEGRLTQNLDAKKLGDRLHQHLVVEMRGSARRTPKADVATVDA
ncbi:MAG: TIGR00159 family protein [Acidobacteria bacterium]|nr:MAG: TIGR00159 family protein [Acidobacteriota bacterium]REK11692.1 MAG: TIGR00159 family protein [Acidobacteriota bacterium]